MLDFSSFNHAIHSLTESIEVIDRYLANGGDTGQPEFRTFRAGVIQTTGTLSLAQISDIKDAFADSDIPFRVDVSDWQLISDSFKRCINKDKVLIYPVIA